MAPPALPATAALYPVPKYKAFAAGGTELWPRTETKNPIKIGSKNFKKFFGRAATSCVRTKPKITFTSLLEHYRGVLSLKPRGAGLKGKRRLGVIFTRKDHPLWGES